MSKWNQPVTDLTGQRFGQLEAIQYVKGSQWVCDCDCGIRTVVNTTKLTSGHTQTCGTHKRGVLATMPNRGKAVNSLYRRWISLRSRCNNPDDMAYANYGGRGISYDAAWDNFEVFLADVGIPHDLKLQLDRIDNEKGYEKGNVRWVKQQRNLNNKRTNRNIEYLGEVKTIAEWAAKLDIHYRTLNNRINRGWDTHRAMNTPSNTGFTGS